MWSGVCGHAKYAVGVGRYALLHMEQNYTPCELELLTM